jgi:hypothetical protein
LALFGFVIALWLNRRVTSDLAYRNVASSRYPEGPNVTDSFT